MICFALGLVDEDRRALPRRLRRRLQHAALRLAAPALGRSLPAVRRGRPLLRRRRRRISGWPNEIRSRLPFGVSANASTVSVASTELVEVDVFEKISEIYLMFHFKGSQYLRNKFLDQNYNLDTFLGIVKWAVNR